MYTQSQIRKEVKVSQYRKRTVFNVTAETKIAKLWEKTNWMNIFERVCVVCCVRWQFYVHSKTRSWRDTKNEKCGAKKCVGKNIGANEIVSIKKSWCLIKSTMNEPSLMFGNDLEGTVWPVGVERVPPQLEDIAYYLDKAMQREISNVGDDMSQADTDQCCETLYRGVHAAGSGEGGETQLQKLTLTIEPDTEEGEIDTEGIEERECENIWADTEVEYEINSPDIQSEDEEEAMEGEGTVASDAREGGSSNRRQNTNAAEYLERLSAQPSTQLTGAVRAKRKRKPI